MTTADDVVDVAIVGAGAAGLATAIFLLRRLPHATVALLDGARRPGAKILVSGGSRCNVTNTHVTEADFNGGRPSVIRSVLRALPVAETVRFFESIGVRLHEEPNGKLFPDGNRSRDVLDALLNELERLGHCVRDEHRVVDVKDDAERFLVTTSRGVHRAHAVVLATGGLSLPKTGSDGTGYTFARRFGHSLVPTTPALVPLLTARSETDAAALKGVSHLARLQLRCGGTVTHRIIGSMLWTHFGLSGPAVLDISRHWLRARLEGRTTELTVSFLPTDTFETLEHTWIALARRQPRVSLQTAIGTMVPASLGAVLLDTAAIERQKTLAGLDRAERRRLVHAMLEFPMAVTESRGYGYAEVTAGGVDVTEIDPSSMQSRKRESLYLVGEILDVDGRIGGFNFQWAWASAYVAARGMASRLTEGARR